METHRQLISGFIDEHRLPASFRSTIDDHYGRVLPWLQERKLGETTLVLGINGAQGTGKSTLADFLAAHARQSAGWNVAVVSIDDFYLTRAERAVLAEEVHPLLKTRGVPGTHDVAMLEACLRDLPELGRDQSLALPRFDKAIDDRAAAETWPSVSGPVDLVILEGWCVGSIAQPEETLHEPCNALERDEDPDGTWRRFVNGRLRDAYEPVFDTLDALIFLKAPDFDAILEWRVEQEEKLAATESSDPSAGRSALMDRAQIGRFIQHYERITRANLAMMPDFADMIVELAADHSISARRTNSPDRRKPPPQ